MADLLREGLITTSRSPWASPIVLVPKKDGSLRLCIDFQKLNAITKPDPFPMPHADDLIDGLTTAHFITTLDLTKGYWQVPMAADAQEKTAFTTVFSKYQYTVMPFGLVGAPSTFQRLMNGLFGDVPHYVAAYLDDVVVFSRGWEDHIRHVEETLHRIEMAGLTLRSAKCHFAMNECSYLGHMVGHGKVQPLLAKTNAVKDFIPPNTKKDVWSFLGMAGYYRRFVPGYATIASPLTGLTKKSYQTKSRHTNEHSRP